MAEKKCPELTELISKNEFLRIIECTVCLEIPFSPIYLCMTGHNICKFCKPNLRECPTCEDVITETRNFSVEEMVLASNHSCAYKDEGCKIKGSGEVLSDHTEICHYRSFICPGDGKWNDCGFSIELSQAREHFLAAHESVKADSEIIDSLAFTSIAEDHSKLKQDIAWRPSIIEQDGKSFLGQLYTRNDIFFWTLFCLGTEEDAGKYKAEIIFTSEKNNGTRLQWNFPVQPIIRCEELEDGNEMKDVLIPSCSFNDFKKVSVRDDGNSKYFFETEYKISKRE